MTATPTTVPEAPPIFLVIERTAGGEIACVYRDRLMADTKRRAIYMLRLDKLPPEQQQFWLSKGCAELLHVYRWLRAEGTLPTQNLADPPREKPARGLELGNWWKPTPLPRGQDWVQPDD